MKNHRGVTAISAVITIMIIILILFFAYELFYVDLFNLFGTKENTGRLANITTDTETVVDKSNVNTNTTDIIPTTPITNNNVYRE